jgi:signal transduction histidine kinase
LTLPLRRWGILLFGLVFQIVGAFLLLRRPADPAVRAIFLTAACLLSYSVLRAAELHVGEILSGPSWWLYLLVGVGVNIGWQVGLVWLALTFPRPHLWLRARRRWALALAAMPVVGTALMMSLAFRPASDPLRGLAALPALLLLMQAALFGLAAICFVTNYRTLDAEDRQRAGWVVLAFAATLAMGLALSTIPDVLMQITRRPNLAPAEAALRNNLIWVAALVIPAAFAVAILRHRLFDLDLVINRALVWGTLTALTMGLYVLIVGALSALFRTSNSPLAFFLATGVIAVLFQPVRQRLQRAINRLMYGDRDDPYAVLSRLGQRLGGALAPDVIAPTIVESIATALKLPYVALTVGSNDFSRSGHGATEVATTSNQSKLLAAWGAPPAYPPLCLPLTHQGQAVGELILAPRGPGEVFSLVDRRLLDDLARQAGVALFAAQQTWQAQQLAGDLQNARARLVTAREEERRRLRRELHDGLGPVLASLTLKVDAARDELAYDAAAAAEMLTGLKGDIQAAVGDVRRLAYDLRPPALDDLGLAASLCLLAERYQSSGLAITCDLPADLPPLPAAVEVAIYRITGEALTNVVRHAGARTWTVRLAVAARGGLIRLGL